MRGSIVRLLSSPAFLGLVLTIVSFWYDAADAAKVRIKDISAFQTSEEADLIGYGLVIGLDGTGDGAGTQFTVQSLVNMMQRMGMTVDQSKVKVKNVAAVMVTAKLSSQQTEGSYFDITVSSVGDASSLQGGTLLMTSLSAPDGTVHAIAQGPVSIGGFNVQVDETNRIVKNYTVVGRVPGGGKITNPLPADPTNEKEFFISLNSPDFTTSHRVAEAINIRYGETAYPVDGGAVKVVVPDTLMHPTLRSRFISDIGQMTVDPDNIAKVIINEKTGTIVAGEHVTISPVAIAHGTITVNIQSRPVISQPEAFSKGETVVTQESQISIEQETARVVELKESVLLSDIADALNKIGATPRDIVAIFQALKQAGALQAELVIL